MIYFVSTLINQSLGKTVTTFQEIHFRNIHFDEFHQQLNAIDSVR